MKTNSVQCGLLLDVNLEALLNNEKGSMRFQLTIRVYEFEVKVSE